VMRSKEVSNADGQPQPLCKYPPRVLAIPGAAGNLVHVTKEEVVAEVASVAEACSLQTVRVTCLRCRCSRLRVFVVDDSNPPADHIARASPVNLTAEICRVKLADPRVSIGCSRSHIGSLAGGPSTTPRLQALSQNAKVIPVLIRRRPLKDFLSSIV
jgi:hypothetical protein